MVVRWTETKHPEKKKNKKTPTLLISSFSLRSCCHPSREGSVSDGATPSVDPYSARCVRDKWCYSPSLRPRCYGKRSALFSMASHGSAQHQPAVELHQWDEHRSALCTKAPSDGRRAASHVRLMTARRN